MLPIFPGPEFDANKSKKRPAASSGSFLFGLLNWLGPPFVDRAEPASPVRPKARDNSIELPPPPLYFLGGNPGYDAGCDLGCDLGFDGGCDVGCDLGGWN